MENAEKIEKMTLKTITSPWMKKGRKLLEISLSSKRYLISNFLFKTNTGKLFSFGKKSFRNNMSNNF